MIYPYGYASVCCRAIFGLPTPMSNHEETIRTGVLSHVTQAFVRPGRRCSRKPIPRPMRWKQSDKSACQHAPAAKMADEHLTGVTHDNPCSIGKKI
jgi:hypothetical protein